MTSFRLKSVSCHRPVGGSASHTALHDLCPDTEKLRQDPSGWDKLAEGVSPWGGRMIDTPTSPKPKKTGGQPLWGAHFIGELDYGEIIHQFGPGVDPLLQCVEQRPRDLLVAFL